VNAPDPTIPLFEPAFSSLTLAPGRHPPPIQNRGDRHFFTPPQRRGGTSPGDDRMWNDAVDDPSTVHELSRLADFQYRSPRSKQRRTNLTRTVRVILKDIEAATLPLRAVWCHGTRNVDAKIKVRPTIRFLSEQRKSYVVRGARQTRIETRYRGRPPPRDVGVSMDAGLDAPTTFAGSQVFTPAGSPGAVNGGTNICPPSP